MYTFTHINQNQITMNVIRLRAMTFFNFSFFSEHFTSTFQFQEFSVTLDTHLYILIIEK